MSGSRSPVGRSGFARRSAAWVSWIFGASILAVVIVAALHVSEGRHFLKLAQHANPGWIMLAVRLQAATYVAQWEVFRGAPRASGRRVPFGAVYGAETGHALSAGLA